MIILTESMIEEMKSPAGGYNMATLRALGIEWPPIKGWKARLIGLPISEKNYEAAKTASFKKRHFFRGNTRRKRR